MHVLVNALLGKAQRHGAGETQEVIGIDQHVESTRSSAQIPLSGLFSTFLSLEMPA